MKSPFKDNFDDTRKNKANEVVDTKTKEEIKAELLKERVKLTQDHKEVVKGFFVAMYLIIRSEAPFSIILEYIYIDKILHTTGILIWLVCFISGIIIVFKLQSNMIKYSINEKRFFAFLEYHLHVPYDYEEKPKPIILFKKLLLYMLYTEIAISSFFIIDYLFGL